MARVTRIDPSIRCEIEKKKVCAYCRVSRNTADQLNSYARQIRVYTDLIRRNPDWQMVEIFADEGITGTSASKRPEFQRMLKLCEQKQIDLIITKSISRFARNTMEALDIVRKLKILGIGVQFEKEGINTLSLGDEMLLNTFTAIAQEESIAISERIRYSNTKRMESGDFIDGNAPYGYRMVDRVLIPNEDEAQIVRDIFDQYLKGASTHEIARNLNDAGIPGKFGRTWKVSTIRYILRNEKIDYIITKSVSRFARNTVECLEYVRMLKARNIGILFEEQNIDTLKCDSELYLVIYAGFAQSESESMSKNITWAFRKNFEDGKVVFNYSKMVGYRKGNDGNPEIIPEEAEVIRNIFDWFLAGRTPREIVDLLIADGIQTKCGKQKWSVGTIQSILRNEKYCGDAILQKTVTIDCISKTHKKNTGEAPMYYVHNNHEAIITREQFNKAQEELLRRNTIAPKMSSRTISAQGRYSRYALTEILHCDECGSRYKRCTWAKRGVKKVMWRCVSRIEHGTQYCKHSPSIEESALHSAIVRAINRFNQENEITYRLLMKASLSDALGIGGSNEEMELLTRRIDTLNAKMMKLINDAVSEGRSIDDNEGEFKEISDEIAQLNSRVSAIKELIANDESAKDRLESINAKVEELKDGITEYDDTIVRQMIECIKVYGDKRIEVIFGGGTSIIEERSRYFTMTEGHYFTSSVSEIFHSFSLHNENCLI